MEPLDLLPPPEGDADPIESATGADLTPPSSPGPIDYRILTLEEIASFVAPVYAQTNNPLPSPQASQIVGAIRDGKVIAFLVIQIRLHAEPMWIAPGESQVFEALVHCAEKTILERTGPQWVYTFTPAGKLSQLAQKMGMQMEPWVVHSKFLMPPEGIALDSIEGTIQ